MRVNQICLRPLPKTVSLCASALHQSSPPVIVISVAQVFTSVCVWLSCLAALTIPMVVLASGPSATVFAVTEVAEGVFVHPGRHVDISHSARGDSANIGFIVGSECIAVVDSGGALNVGKALHQAIKARSSKPICYVINTHVHFDHVLGNAAFAYLNVEFVGHQNLAQALTANREFFSDNFAQELGGGSAPGVIAPTIVVEETLQLDLGQRILTLTAQPVSHSHTDLTVLDKQTKTLFSGDLVSIDRLPIIDGSLKGWLAWIAEAEALSISQVVPGHGPTSAPWPEAVDPLLDYLNALLRDGRNAVRDGVTLGDATATMSRAAAQPWLVNDRHGRNVSKVYRELEWE
jgi:quinoprotein relay system zinc metallohydrolase 2